MKELQDDGATQRRPSSPTRGFISANMISADSPEIERCNEMDAAVIGGWLRDELEAADWRLYGAALLEVLSAGRRGEERRRWCRTASITITPSHVTDSESEWRAGGVRTVSKSLKNTSKLHVFGQK